MTPPRRAIAAAALGAGVSYANLAVALPLLVLATGGSATLAGGLIAVNTLAFSLGALLALALRRSETLVLAGLASIAAGDVLLSLSPATAMLAAGALLQGTGMGLFWVGTQASLGKRSGSAGSERAFVRQYSLYVVGTASGGALTGVTAALLRASGVAHADSIRFTFLVGAAGALAGLAASAWALRRVDESPVAWATPAPLRGLALQVPDLLLVAAMGLLLNLAPVVLGRYHGFSTLAVGVVSATVAGAKIGGSIVAGRVTGVVGSKRGVGAMLAGSALAAAALAGTHRSLLFVALVVATTFFAIGVWPVVVDGALARVSPADRPGLAVVWNVREYAVIAAVTVLGGSLLDATGAPTLLLAFVAVLLAGAALAALAVLGRPVYAPQTA